VIEDAHITADFDGSEVKRSMDTAVRRVQETLSMNPRSEEFRCADDTRTTEEEARQHLTAVADSDERVVDENKEETEHYWGQALQYLERGVQVRAGKKIALLAKRQNGGVHFSLKEGVGSWVGKPPWKIEWGGGASVESPHFQRVHYCQLLVNDFLMRLRCKRFAPIEKDMKMILAHCGALFLEPQSVTDVYHYLVMLEVFFDWEEFSPGVTVESLTKQHLRLA
jgi:protein arginine N-methyltransferase 7